MAPSKQAAKIKADLFIAQLVGNPAEMLPLFWQVRGAHAPRVLAMAPSPSRTFQPRLHGNEAPQ
jgi:hypothetical protein